MENSNSDAVPYSPSRLSPSRTTTLSNRITQEHVRSTESGSHYNTRVRQERSRSPRARTLTSTQNLLTDSRENSIRRPPEPPYFWNMTSSQPIPPFDSEPRDFEPGRLDIPRDFVTEFPREAWGEVQTWIGELRNLHGDYRDRHAELVEMIQELESGMRRLEAKRKHWLSVELDKISPMPRALRSYIRRINGGD